MFIVTLLATPIFNLNNKGKLNHNNRFDRGEPGHEKVALLKFLTRSLRYHVYPMYCHCCVCKSVKFQMKIFGVYGDLVNKFKKIIGNPNYSDLFKRIVNRFWRAGYTLDIMRQTACIVFNPIMVEGYAALFSCTAVVKASDSMTASM